jgi:predicted aldo/keto reductase-like oxidoreductase
MNAPEFSRRRFIRKAASVTGIAALAPLPFTGCQTAPGAPARRTAVDTVTLGRTGLQLSRLGIGTGSNSGEVQRALGRDGFNRLLRYAYDQGITYIDTAENYKTHEWIRDAIKGLPREKLFIQTKIPGTPENPRQILDRYRQELNTDYFDSVLCHYATTDRWDDERRRVMDAIEEAKEKKIIRAKGVSCHGLPALTRATKVNWVDVHLVRLNPMGHKVDGATFQWEETGNVPAVVEQVKAMRAQGRGIIGMKLIGNGDFTKPEEREKSIRYVMQSGLADAVVIGFKSSAEIDEAIERINRALAEA